MEENRAQAEAKEALDCKRRRGEGKWLSAEGEPRFELGDASRGLREREREGERAHEEQ